MEAYSEENQNERPACVCEGGKHFVAKFSLGRICMTAAADAKFGPAVIGPLLRRHINGDWGNVCREDKGHNDAAIEFEGDPDKQQRVLSVYDVGGDPIWIITEWDRSVTTLLLPEDY